MKPYIKFTVIFIVLLFHFLSLEAQSDSPDRMLSENKFPVAFASIPLSNDPISYKSASDKANDHADNNKQHFSFQFSDIYCENTLSIKLFNYQKEEIKIEKIFQMGNLIIPTHELEVGSYLLVIKDGKRNHQFRIERQ
ncbi:hypothetical protein [Portibacter marinus]|uniref:hypothetical protein n=1 Tax=Portibacter marinus TaxID=2898660 RepID=UPI001F3B1648|nr:hypothetical protein [Portibacter marinus]